MVHKAGIGTSINWTLGSDVTWKGGRSISLDDSESVSLKTNAKTQANNEVLISGGQRTALKAIIDPLKSKVKRIVSLNIAANVAVAASVAGAIGKFADAGQSPKDDGKIGPWNPYGYGVTAAQAGLNTVSTLVTHLVVRAAANAITTALKADSSYASNIRVNGTGINLQVDSLAQATGRIQVTENCVAISTATLAPTMAQSSVALEPTELKLTGNGMGADDQQARPQRHQRNARYEEPRRQGGDRTPDWGDDHHRLQRHPR